MRIRPTTGVIVIDENQRVLLFKVQDTIAIDIARPGLTIWWGPPGGGVESAETFGEAGLRELWEEAGIRVPRLGPWVATYERTIRFPDETVLFHIRYFIVDVPASDIDIANLQENERAIYRDHRWWTIEQIEQSDESFLPPGLSHLLRTIINGTFSSKPVMLH